MIIKVKVKPNSRRQSIEQENGVYNMDLKEKADKGKANLEIIKLLAKHFKVSSSQVRIKSGITSKNKIIEIQRSQN